MPRTYQKLYRQKAVMTNIDGKPLWFGLRVTGDELSTFLLALPMWWLIDLSPIGLFLGIWFNGYVVVFLGAFFSTLIVRKLDPDGISLPRYLLNAVLYAFRSKISDGWKRLPRALGKKKGRRTSIHMKVKHSWTDRDVPLPAVAKSGSLQFENQVHVDVKMNKGRTVFRQSQRLRLPFRRQAFGVRPGSYQVLDGELRKSKKGEK